MSKNSTWMWGSSQTETFTKVREALHNQRSWHCMTQWLQRKLELMHPPMVWEQFSCRSRRTPAGGQSSILPDPCLQLKCSMLKLRKRPSLQHGPVRVSSWGRNFQLKLTTNHWSIKRTSTLCHLQSSGFAFAWLDLTTQ